MPYIPSKHRLRDKAETFATPDIPMNPLTQFRPKRALMALKVALVGALAVACTTVPETGRSTVNLFTGDALDAQASAQFQQMKEELAIS
ncbi:MAG: hypothetical protein ACFB21_10255, partial [Opitutales bacterium]